jgi:integrase
MGVKLMRQRDGTLRAHWYGVYGDGGARKVVNLGVTWKGTPPASGSLRDPGDKDFERSREKAEDALARHVEEARHKGRAEHLTERLIESKTGRPVEYADIQDLPRSWRTLGRESMPSDRYLSACDAHFNRFADFMRDRNPAAVRLYEVTPEDAAGFVALCRKTLAPATAKYGVRLLNKALARFLPVGTANPFAAFVGRRTNGESGIVHRKPFTPEELRALLAAARDDDFMHPLIVTAACSGMRRGDVCGLPWSAVDLAEGMLAVKTSKTGADVEIPIFAPLRAVLEARKGNGKEHVFPDAARMLAENPNGLTWRFKKIVARAFAGDAPPPALPEPVPAADIEAEGAEAIRAHVPEGDRRERVLDTLRRYAAGESVRQIEKATGTARATVSTDLHAVETWTGKPFMRGGGDRQDVKEAMALHTRLERPQGQRAASVRDWHALRATWVTLALAAGVPVELVRRVTGHATVEIVLKHYFRPDREQFRAALTGALPGILTGGTPAKVKPAEELATLAGKLAAGTATKEDKARLRKLAAKV